MINFALPGLWTSQSLILTYLDLLRLSPEFFYDDLKINAVYGNFPFCTWDGGRIISPNSNFNYFAPIEEITRIQYLYKFYGVKVRFIFTNTLIKEEDCFDRYNNFILSVFDNDENEVVVNSPLLEQYIRENYHYNFISSTTKCITNKNNALEEIANPNYKYICLDYNLNKNKTFLNSIPEEQKEKVEFLINAICPAGCPARKHHYDLNSIYSLAYGKLYHLPNCRLKENTLTLNSVNNFTAEEVLEYSKNNFINFKLEGRTLTDVENCINFVKFTVKPEHMLKVIDIILDKINYYSLLEYFEIANQINSTI